MEIMWMEKDKWCKGGYEKGIGTYLCASV